MADKPEQALPKKRSVQEMADREGKRRSGKRRPGFDRAVDSQERPLEPGARRPGYYETK
jgi:hypothetical protein